LKDKCIFLINLKCIIPIIIGTVDPARNVWRGHEREWHDYATVPGPTSSSHTRLHRLSIIKNTWSWLKLLSHLAVLFHESLSRLHIANSHESNLRVLSLLLTILIPRDLSRWSLKTERPSDFQSKPTGRAAVETQLHYANIILHIYADGMFYKYSSTVWSARYFLRWETKYKLENDKLTRFIYGCFRKCISQKSDSECFHIKKKYHDYLFLLSH